MDDLRVSFPKPCSERWDDMRPQGCNRFCVQCQKTIHDLCELTLEEAEKLAISDAEICVRARVGRDGEIELKDSNKHKGRRLMAASVTMLVAACQTAGPFPAKGIIAGKVDLANRSTVTATDHNGRIYRTKTNSDGSYAFKPLPYGRYSLKYHGLCERWDGGTVEVKASEAVAPPLTEPLDDCIIIGQIRIDDGSRTEG